MREGENYCYDKTYIKGIRVVYLFPFSIGLVYHYQSRPRRCFFFFSNTLAKPDCVGIVYRFHSTYSFTTRKPKCNFSSPPFGCGTKYSEDYLKLVSIAHPPPQ